MLISFSEVLVLGQEKEKESKITQSVLIRANRVDLPLLMLGKIQIKVLDEKFGFEHDRLEMLIRHPSRHVEEAVGG